MSKIRFREDGLYALPNGQEFILLPGEDCYLLCSSEDKVEESLIDYRLSRDGRIYRRGMRTDWGVENLTDTGKSAERLIKKVSATVR